MSALLFVAPMRLMSVKRPRTRSAQVLICSTQKNDSVELTRKVEETLMDVEQAPPAPTPASPRPLPVQRRLLAYHARRLSRRSGTRAAAEAMYKRVLEQDSADGRAWLGLGKLRAADGRIAEARATLQEGARICARNAHILQYWGVLEERAGNRRQAHALYSEATRADETHAPAWVALGLWHQRYARNYDAASDCFARGAAADRDNYYVWHAWGVLERERRRFAAARHCFERGVCANPRNGATLVVWGALEAQVGHPDAAMRLFRRAHRVAPRNAHAYVTHATVAERAGHVSRARALLARAQAVRPRDPAPLQSLALLEARAGRYDLARARFRDALALSKAHAPSWHSWACMERSLGDLPRARDLFQHAIWAAPGRAHAVRTWHAWACLERSAGREALARRYVAHGLRVDRRSPALLTLLAQIEAGGGDIARARDLLEFAVKESPRERFVWRAYESMEREAGFSDRADAVHQRALVAGRFDRMRLTVSRPLPGDFASAGMWIGPEELRGRDAADVRETTGGSGDGRKMGDGAQGTPRGELDGDGGGRDKREGTMGKVE